MNDKQKLLKQLQMYNFAVVDASLFLDTHPHDQNALKYFKRVSRLRDEARENYEKKYGPTRVENNTNENEWEWATCPFPWEV